MVLCFAKALGEFGATITFVSNIPGETQTHLGGDLHLHADSRRRRRGGAAGHRRDRHRARRARRVGMARAPRRHALPRRLSMLAVDVEKRLGEFHDRRAGSRRAGGVDRAVRPVGRGQDLDRQHDRRPAHAGPRPHRARRHACCSTAPRASTCRPHRRRIGYVFQEGRLFPHLTVARNLDYGRRMSGLARRPGGARAHRRAARHRRLLDAPARASCPAASASASRSAARC